MNMIEFVFPSPAQVSRELKAGILGSSHWFPFLTDPELKKQKFNVVSKARERESAQPVAV